MKASLASFASVALGLLLFGSAAAQTPPGVPPGGPPLNGGPPPGGPPLNGAPPGGPPLQAAPGQADANLKPNDEGPPGQPEDILRGLLPPLPANTPMPSRNPHDLQGTWVHDQPLQFRIDKDINGKDIPFTAKGRSLLEKRVAAQKAGSPFANAAALCYLDGLPWQFDLNQPFQVFQSPKRLDMVFQENHGFVTVYLDPSKAPPASMKTYMGTSIGHWEGNTLVVVTKNLKQGIWVDVTGTPASIGSTLTMRIRKVHVKGTLWELQVVNTLEDSRYYTRPWSWLRTYAWRPDKDMFLEFDCENQAGGRGNNVNVGLVAEPPEDE